MSLRGCTGALPLSIVLVMIQKYRDIIITTGQSPCVTMHIRPEGECRSGVVQGQSPCVGNVVINIKTCNNK